MDSTISVIESRVDALTCGFHTPESADVAHRRANIWIEQERGDGSQLKQFRTHGYDMVSAGRVAVGRRPDGVLLKLSEELAETHCDELVSTASTVSRVDFCVTARCSPRRAEVAAIHYAEAMCFFESHPTSAEPALIQRGTGGETCMLGRRASDFYLRCYDKEQESWDLNDPARAAHYSACWRYELEIKGVNARAQAKVYTSQRDTATWIQAMLYQYAVNHGLVPTFLPTATAGLLPSVRRRSDRESKLAWLRKSVAPSLAWLGTNTSRAEIMDALGLVEAPGRQGSG